MHYVLVISR